MGARQRQRLHRRRKAAEARNRSRGLRRAAVTGTVMTGLAGVVASGVAVPAAAAPAPVAKLVKDLVPGPGSSYPQSLQSTGNQLLFSAYDVNEGSGLYRTNAGTGVPQRLDLPVGSGDVVPVGGTLFYTADDAGGEEQLWASDGTAAGARKLTSIVGEPVYVPGYTDYYGNEYPGQYVDPDNVGYRQVAVGGTLFFTANDGSELWKSNGTPAGTAMVKDLEAVWGENGPSDLTAVGNRLYFTAESGDGQPAQLWTSDGTPAGTRALTALPYDDGQGYYSSPPSDLTAVGGTLFFTAGTGDTGRELWKSNGTPAGTVLVKDVDPGAGSGSPDDLTAVGNRLFFSVDAYDGSSSVEELWSSTGTSQGTTRFAALDEKDIRNTVAVGGTMFMVRSGFGGVDHLWRTDGTAAGTRQLTQPGLSYLESGYSYDLVGAGSRVYFVGAAPAKGRELWSSDGTVAGTAMVADIRPGAGDSDPSRLTAVGSTVFFSADDGTRGTELWSVSVPAAPPAPPVTPPAPDRVLSGPSVTGPSAQKQPKGAVKVSVAVGAAESVTMTVQGSVQAKGLKKVALTSVSTTGAAGQRKTVALAGSKKARKSVAKAVGRYRAAKTAAAKRKLQVTATVTVQYRDAAGNKATRTLTVKLT